jgi:hypothetical protein
VHDLDTHGGRPTSRRHIQFRQITRCVRDQDM